MYAEIWSFSFSKSEGVAGGFRLSTCFQVYLIGLYNNEFQIYR